MKPLCLTVVFLVAASQAAAQDVDGKAVYAKQCQKCHGASGTPPAAMVKMNPTLKPLTTEVLAGKTDEQLITLLTNGSENGKKKPLKDKMTPEEMAAAVKYLREMVKGG